MGGGPTLVIWTSSENHLFVILPQRDNCQGFISNRLWLPATHVQLLMFLEWCEALPKGQDRNVERVIDKIIYVTLHGLGIRAGYTCF